jgi:hypothetical protein
MSRTKLAFSSATGHAIEAVARHNANAALQGVQASPREPALGDTTILDMIRCIHVDQRTDQMRTAPRQRATGSSVARGTRAVARSPLRTKSCCRLRAMMSACLATIQNGSKSSISTRPGGLTLRSQRKASSNFLGRAAKACGETMRRAVSAGTTCLLVATLCMTRSLFATNAERKAVREGGGSIRVTG